MPAVLARNPRQNLPRPRLGGCYTGRHVSCRRCASIPGRAARAPCDRRSGAALQSGHHRGCGAGGVLARLVPLLALAALQLALTLSFGPRLCLACFLYFNLLRPWLGPGPVKNARPVRFANLVGLVFLSAASLAHLAGFPRLGWTLGLVVAGLALLAASTGLCVGCEMYRLLARLRGIGPRSVARIDLQEIGASPQAGLVVQFTHPRCSDCRSLEERLSAQGVPLALVDVTQHPDLARKYGISLVPLAFKVDSDGRVLARVTSG